MDDKLLLSAEESARFAAGVSAATWWRWDAAGKIPAPIRPTRGVTRWRRSDLERWVELGCPKRREFEALMKGNGRPRG